MPRPSSRPQTGTRPRPNPAQRRLLDSVEAAIRGIRWPVDSAEMFQHECHLALEDAGLYCVRETPMEGNRRVDLVVVDSRGPVAIELDRDVPRRETLGKFADMPPEVLRVLVLRRRKVYAPMVPHCDRVVCVNSSLRMVRMLVDGVSGVPDEGADGTRGLVNSRRAGGEWRWSLLQRAHRTG